MRTGFVVIGTAATEQPTDLGEGGEQRLVQEFVAQALIDRTDHRVLSGLSPSDVVRLDPGLVSPAQDRVAGELGAVVSDDHLRLGACDDHPIEFDRHPQARVRRVGNQGDVHPGAIVDDRRNAEAGPSVS